MITLVTGVEPIKMVIDQWMPPGMIVVIVDDNAYVCKNGKVAVMPVSELSEIAENAFNQVMEQKRLDARQPF